MATTYTSCRAEDVPVNVTFYVPRRHQGQIVEYAYGTTGRAEADHGDPYQRVTDQSYPTGHPERVRFYRLTTE